MAQDKIAEIIKFSGANDAAGDAAPEAPAEAARGAASDEPGDAQGPALDETSAGTFLREARNRAKLSIDAASAATKVKAEHLEAIEWMRLDRLPALPYAIGFVKAYARFLALDADAVAVKFKAEALAIKPAVEAETGTAGSASSAPAGEGARLGSVFAMLAVALFALWIGYQVVAGGDRQTVPAQRQADAVSDTKSAPETSAPIANAIPEAAAPSVAVGELLPDAVPPTDDASATADETQTSPDEETVAAAIPSDAEETQAPSEQATEPARVIEETVSTVPATPAQRRDRPLPRRAQPARQPQIIGAELTHSSPPDYPNRCARGARDLESVTILFDVSPSGRAVNARVESSTNGCFEGEALRTLGRWRFSPRTVDGEAAAEAGKRATLNFKQ